MRRVLILVLTATLSAVVGLTGCGSDEEDPAVLPPATATPTPSPSPTSTKGMYDKQQIKYVYRQLNDGYNAAQTMPKKKRRAFLGQWMVDPALSSWVSGMEKDARRHHRTYGRAVPHIFRVSVHGDTARLEDCADESATVLKNTKSGKVIRKGSEHVWLIATLHHTNDGWRVKYTRSKDKSCAGR